MYYVYILRSQKDNSKYVGVTSDLKKRLQQHNHHQSKFTSSKAPYSLIWYCAMPDKENAYKFEKYLKSSSGYAFTNKHLI